MNGVTLGQVIGLGSVLWVAFIAAVVLWAAVQPETVARRQARHTDRGLGWLVLGLTMLAIGLYSLAGWAVIQVGGWVL